jgi:hypothetical protein
MRCLGEHRAKETLCNVPLHPIDTKRELALKEEHMPISQGRLTIGFTSSVCLSDDDYYARIASSIHMVTSELKADLNEKIRQILQYQKDTKGEISKLEILMQAIQKSLENKTIIQTADQDDDFRVDTIVDNETDNTVTNYLKNGKIIKSIMTNPEGIIVYELEFDNGNISRSRSYNDKGDMTIEQTFYENGQVHYRHEYTSKGKTTTEFDFNGKKI